MKTKMIRTIILILTLAIVSCGSALMDAYEYEDWWLVGNRYFSDGKVAYVSLAFDGDTPYVAYQDIANSSKVTVMKLNGNTWEAVGAKGFSTGTATNVSIAVFNGSPYVVFNDAGESNCLRVLKFSGISWYEVIRDTSAIYGAKIAVGNESIYYASKYSSNSIIVYSSINGSDWVWFGTGINTGWASESYNIAVSNGVVYVAFSDYASVSGRASVVKYNGSSWQDVGSRGFTDAVVSYNLALAVENGVPYVAYKDPSNGNGLTVMGYVNNEWSVIGNKNITGYQTGTAVALCVFNGAPFVFANFNGVNKLEYAYWWNGSSWDSIGNFMKYSNSYSVVVHDGQPYVAFAESWNDRGIDSMATVLRYGPRH